MAEILKKMDGMEKEAKRNVANYLKRLSKNLDAPLHIYTDARVSSSGEGPYPIDTSSYTTYHLTPEGNIRHEVSGGDGGWTSETVKKLGGSSVSINDYVERAGFDQLRSIVATLVEEGYDI